MRLGPMAKAGVIWYVASTARNGDGRMLVARSKRARPPRGVTDPTRDADRAATPDAASWAAAPAAARATSSAPAATCARITSPLLLVAVCAALIGRTRRRRP